MTASATNHDAISHLSAADPVLAGLIARIGPIDARPAGDPYPELVRAIIYQQLAGAAAATIERRFRALYPDSRVPTPEELLSTPDEALRGAGVSRQKIGYLRDLARHAAEGRISDDLRTLPDEEVITRVTAVKGIGRWTADMLLLFCLGRPDVLPVGDLGVRRAMQRAYGLPALPKPAEMETLAAPWRPHRGMASRYLWRSLDTVTL
jgi:DNA-3-methyladenine glycosylase II